MKRERGNRQKERRVNVGNQVMTENQVTQFLLVSRETIRRAVEPRRRPPAGQEGGLEIAGA